MEWSVENSVFKNLSRYEDNSKFIILIKIYLITVLYTNFAFILSYTQFSLIQHLSIGFQEMSL